MKKFWTISMLILAALFVVSCGGDDEDNDGDNGNSIVGSACDASGTFKCDKNMVYICDEEEGSWQKRQQCNDDQTCNATTGKCDSQSSNSGNDNQNPNGGEDNPEPTPEPENALTCSEIYNCMVNCGQDGECQQGCYDKGDATSQSQIMALLNCLNTCNDSSSTDEEFQNCANSQCASEISNCGLGGGSPADTSYANPYGTAQINISSTYIVTDADSQLGQEMVTMGSFISGNIGNSQIANPAAQQSYYYTMMYTEQGETMMQTAQYFTDSTGQNILNPFVVTITNVTASVGSNYYGLLEETGVGYVMIVDVTVAGNQLNLNCYHAFSEGELTVQNISAAAGSAGALAVSGSVNLYSPKNYANGYGDISDQLGVNVCPAK